MRSNNFIINAFIALSLLITTGFISVAQTPVETHGRLRVEGNQIVGEHGEPVQLMGMSHYWSVWGPQKYYNKDVVIWLVEDWHTHHVHTEPAKDGGRDGTIYPDETEEWINWALERNISMANWSLADLSESSAALNSGASVSGGWDPETDLSPSGKLLRNHIIRINSLKPYNLE